MSKPSTNHRKSSTKNNETISGTHDKAGAHDHMETYKKYEMPVFAGTHRKSDAEKASYADTSDKGNYACIDFY
jgi:hypothetical protein